MNTCTRISPTRIGLTIACHWMAALALCGPATASEADAKPVPVADYTVFVDPPTGFVFVKLPTGWKFAGQISESHLANLPGTVVTSLLTRDAASASAALAPVPAGNAATAHAPAIAIGR